MVVTIKSLVTLTLAFMASAQAQLQAPLPYPPGSTLPPGFGQVYNAEGCTDGALWANFLNVDTNCDICWTPPYPFKSAKLQYSDSGISGYTITCDIYKEANCTQSKENRIGVGTDQQSGCTSLKDVGASIKCCATPTSDTGCSACSRWNTTNP